MPENSNQSTDQTSDQTEKTLSQATSEKLDQLDDQFDKLKSIIVENKPIAILAAVGLCGWIIGLTLFFQDGNIRIPFTDSAFLKYCTSSLQKQRRLCVCVDNVLQQNLTSKEYKLFAIGAEHGTQAMSRAVPNIGIMQAAELEAKMMNVSRYADQICRQ